MAKQAALAVLMAAAVGSLSPVAFADEVVKFTNGAEMPVVSHTVEKDMVKLDLGNNSFIAFPMSMVDKIANAGKDVFLNPSFHLSNQAVSTGAGSGAFGGNGNGVGGVPGGVANAGYRGAGGPGGNSQPTLPPGAAGVMLGEAADIQPQETHGDPTMAQADVNRRRIYNPAFTRPPGGMPQVIMPPSMKTPGRVTLMNPPRSSPPPPPPQPQPVPGNTSDNSNQGDPPPPDSGDNNN